MSKAQQRRKKARRRAGGDHAHNGQTPRPEIWDIVVQAGIDLPPCAVVVSGAGASVGAGVPHANGMLGAIESNFSPGGEWGMFSGDYANLKNALRDESTPNGTTVGNLAQGKGSGHAFGLDELVDLLRYGVPGSAVPEKRREKMHKLAMHDIGRMLKLGNPRTSAYLKMLRVLLNSLGIPVHLFSLNFDTCIEELHSEKIPVVTGFGGFGERHGWNFGRFLAPEIKAALYLYKLHGSMNWRLSDSGVLYSVSPSDPVDMLNAQVLLGRIPKKAGNFPLPFPHYVQRFFDLTLATRCAYVVGYGFGDPEINKMLQRFVTEKHCDRLVVVTRFDGMADPKKEVDYIREQLLGSDKVRVYSV